jgi:hypothetical protein
MKILAMADILAICGDCGAKFEVNEGPSMMLELLHCERCGREKWIGIDKLLEGSAGEADDESDFNRWVELNVRKCRWGRRYRREGGAMPKVPIAVVRMRSGRPTDLL